MVHFHEIMDIPRVQAYMLLFHEGRYPGRALRVYSESGPLTRVNNPHPSVQRWWKRRRAHATPDEPGLLVNVMANSQKRGTYGESSLPKNRGHGGEKQDVT